MRLHMHTRHAHHSVCRLLGAFPCVCTAAYGPWVVHMPAYGLHMHTRHAYHLVCRLLLGFPGVCTAAYGPWVLHMRVYETAYAHAACIPFSIQVAGSIPYCMHRWIWALGLAYASVCGCICTRGMHTIQYTGCFRHSLVYALLHMGPAPCICQGMRLHMHTRHAYHSVYRLLGAFPGVCTAAYGPCALHMQAYAAAYAHVACIPFSIQVARSIPYCMHCCIWALGVA
jgi:hypothetical protein